MVLCLGQPAGVMNVTAWLTPEGFPRVAPYKEFVPKPGSARPLYRNIAVAGTIASVGPSEIELEALSISHVGKVALGALWGEKLTVDFGPPIELGHLLKGNRVSLLVDISGHLAPHLRSTEWGARGKLCSVFWMSRPALKSN